jgi:hypothetical protein
MSKKIPGRVLYTGQAYYNTWYLSRALREHGWRAEVLNWDTNPDHAGFYHGEDHTLELRGRGDVRRHLRFYLWALRNFDVFHFTGMHGIVFSPLLQGFFARTFGKGSEIRLLKRLGKKVVYSGNGCLDGVAKSSFAAWGDRPVCHDCSYRDDLSVCSDEGNLAWGKFRNSVADYQVLMGGNRVDYNADPRCHEVPEFYCLDTDFWKPELLIPTNYRLQIPDETVKLYHGVGNFDSRSDAGDARNIKSTHIYLKLIEELKAEGHPVELIFFKDVPNKQLRYYQAQADIVVDMLTFGWFGANVREALMLGKPVVSYVRPEWLEGMRKEIPEFVDELPIVSATPETVKEVVLDLVNDREKRLEIGRRSRAFAVKHLSAEKAARSFDKIYSGLLEGRPGTEDFRSGTPVPAGAR